MRCWTTQREPDWLKTNEDKKGDGNKSNMLQGMGSENGAYLNTLLQILRQLKPIHILSKRPLLLSRQTVNFPLTSTITDRGNFDTDCA